jgi:hypothetical protein
LPSLHTISATAYGVGLSETCDVCKDKDDMDITDNHFYDQWVGGSCKADREASGLTWAKAPNGSVAGWRYQIYVKWNGYRCG